jgi:hypothetical protein
MPNRKWLPGLLVVLAISLAATFFHFHYWPNDPLVVRNEMLARMPANCTAVVFLDLAALRSSPFLAQLFAWAPHPAPDADYTQFVQATGFDYERDLERVAIGFSRAADRASILAIADGRFDRQKIAAYLQRSGKPAVQNGATVFSIAPAGTAGASFLTFLREDRIAWTNDPSAEALFWQRDPFAAEWRERFGRLAGTPMFAVIRQDSGAAAALAQQAPGGFRSPQLAALLAQLQWISIGAKPDGNLLRVVADGECDSETTMRQLSEFLNGILLLAQGGLNGADMRKKLDPQLREGYLELLQSAEVQKVDRGTSRSVRVVFDVTPKLLQALREAEKPAGAPIPATAGQAVKH